MGLDVRRGPAAVHATADASDVEVACAGGCSALSTLARAVDAKVPVMRNGVHMAAMPQH